MIELTFREAMKEDIVICSKLISSSEAWSTLGIDYNKAFELLDSMEDRIYVAENNNNIVGLITLRPNGMGNFGAYIRMIAIKEELRNSGIGKQLVNFIESVAAKHDKNMFLVCSITNVSAISFYEAIGFERVGVLSNLFIDGHDEILYRKRIV